MDKYKDLLVEAWSWDSECLMLIKAIDKTDNESEKQFFIDSIADILTRQVGIYKKKMKAEHDEVLDKITEAKVRLNSIYGTTVRYTDTDSTYVEEK